MNPRRLFAGGGWQRPKPPAQIDHEMDPTFFSADALLESLRDIEWGPIPADRLLSAGVRSVNDTELRDAVAARLQSRPELIQEWQQYSWDKRWGPSPYIDGLEVGHYDSDNRHVRHHETPEAACADFILREVRWIVDRRIVTA